MIDRISAIDNIRALLEREMEQDNGLLAEFTDKVVVLEGQLGEKNGCIGMLEREVDGLKRKNGDYAMELTSECGCCMSCAHLVHNSSLLLPQLC